jgi:hypothetical protein
VTSDLYYAHQHGPVRSGCRFPFFPFDHCLERRNKDTKTSRKLETEKEISMRFLCLYKPSKAEGTPPTQAEIAAMGQLIEEMVKDGSLVSTEGCQPSAKGARVRLANGQITVTDGPFVETKELIGGFAIIQARSKAEAIELTKRFLKVAGDGESEIRLLHEPTDFAPEHASAREATTR